MLEAGKKFRHLVQFTSGQPTSDLTYTLYNQDGGVVLTETAPILAGDVSYLIEIPAGSNSLSKPMMEKMSLEWEYVTATEAVSDSISYVIHAPINFPVSNEGVRNLLGVDSEELEDNDINLFEGYMAFRQMVGSDVDLTPYETAGDFDTFQITKAIEAATALRIFPTIQLRLPRKYDSGTSSYERWNSIDWAAMSAELTSILYGGLELLDPDIEIMPVIDIFGLSVRGPDPITGV